MDFVTTSIKRDHDEFAEYELLLRTDDCQRNPNLIRSPSNQLEQ